MLHWYHNKRQNLLQQEKNNQGSQNETLIPMLLTTYFKKNESLGESGSCPLQRLTQNMIVLILVLSLGVVCGQRCKGCMESQPLHTGKLHLPKIKAKKPEQRRQGNIPFPRGTSRLMGIVANDLNRKRSLVLWNAHSLLSKAVWVKDHSIDLKIDFFFPPSYN